MKDKVIKEEKVDITQEMVDGFKREEAKEILPREEVISGTQKECDSKLRELKGKYEVATIGISVSNNFVSYTLWLSKK